MAFLRPSAWMTEMQGIGNRAVCPIHELGEIRGCGSYTTWDVKKAGIHEHETDTSSHRAGKVGA